jgi:3-hydroxymyristoyl/3-hydroxydecanoyl-(acyl carrier protein) dehydratase
VTSFQAFEFREKRASLKMSIQVEFENKDQVLNAIKDVRNDSTVTDWAIIGHFEENPNKLAVTYDLF